MKRAAQRDQEPVVQFFSPPPLVLLFFLIRLTFSACFPNLVHRIFRDFLQQSVVADLGSQELIVACRQNMLSRVREILGNNPELVRNLKSKPRVNRSVSRHLSSSMAKNAFKSMEIKTLA